MRLSLSDYARRDGLRAPDDSDTRDNIGRIQFLARSLSVASSALSDGERLELQSEPGRALSETEATDAIRAGKTVEVVS